MAESESGPMTCWRFLANWNPVIVRIFDHVAAYVERKLGPPSSSAEGTGYLSMRLMSAHGTSKCWRQNWGWRNRQLDH